MTADPVLPLAREAAALWGGCIGAPRLVAQRENVVFDVQIPAGRAALRLHRPGHTDLAAIETELGWTEALAEAGVACPQPMRSATGRLCESVRGRAVSVVTWVDAPTLASRTQCGSDDLHHRLGRCLAEFHSAADRLHLCPVPRQTWKAADLLGPAPRWGGFWDNAALSPDEMEFLFAARDATCDALAALDHPDVGLIHADALQENVLDDGKRLWLIDFDDSGWGYRGYDLGTALVQGVTQPGLHERIAALAEGYAAARPGASGLAKQIPHFIAIRGLVTAGWITSRVAAGDPRLRHYAERALAAARLLHAA